MMKAEIFVRNHHLQPVPFDLLPVELKDLHGHLV